MQSSAQILMLMCQWLNARSKKTSDLLFTKYYSALASRLKRVIGRHLHDQPVTVIDEIFHDVIIKHIAHLSSRTTNAARILAITNQVVPPITNNLIVLQVIEWHRQIQHWVEQENLAHCMNTTDSDLLEHRIRALNESLQPLLESGLRCLNNLTMQLHAGSSGLPPTLPLSSPSVPPALSLADIPALHSQLGGIAQQGHNALDRALGADHFGNLVLGIIEILELAPSVRMPTLILLYKIAQNRAIDTNRATPPPAISLELDQQHGEDAASPLDAAQFLAMRNPLSADPDPFMEQASQKLALADYYRLLYQPVRQAEQQLKNVSSKQDEARGRLRFEKTTRQYQRNCTILDLFLDGYTENEIAEALALTRDQIRSSKVELRARLTPYLKEE